MTSFISPPRRCLTRCSPKPGDRVGNVALAAAIRPDNRRYSLAGEAKVSMVCKGLESRDFEALKLEHRCPSFDAGGDGHQRVTFGRHYREMPPTCQQELEPLGFKLQRCARLVFLILRSPHYATKKIIMLLTCGLPLQHEIYALPQAVGVVASKRNIWPSIKTVGVPVTPTPDPFCMSEAILC